MIESGPTRQLIDRPAHPYSLGLLRCAPEASAPRAELPAIPGTVPNLTQPPVGCAFRERCFAADARCLHTPSLSPCGADEQLAACWHPQLEQRHV